MKTGFNTDFTLILCLVYVKIYFYTPKYLKIFFCSDFLFNKSV